MAYKLQFHKKAKGELANIVKTNRSLAVQIKVALEKLSLDPSQGIPLTGNWKGYYKYRVRDYRIVYEIQESELVVFILRIRHRKEVYD